MSSPFSASLSNTGANQPIIPIQIMFFACCPSIPMGRANGSATSGPPPLMMAKAQPTTLAIPHSAADAPPMFTIPMNTASREAPISSPCCISPKSQPTMGQMNTGRSSMVNPSKSLTPDAISTMTAITNAVTSIDECANMNLSPFCLCFTTLLKQASFHRKEPSEGLYPEPVPPVPLTPPPLQA